MKYFDYKQMLQKSDDTTRACKKKKKNEKLPFAETSGDKKLFVFVNKKNIHRDSDTACPH